MSTFLSAAEAAAELGINVPTLYAYVSRGLLRSEAERGSRRRRYLADDVWTLKQRKVHRADPAAAAQGALHWGFPVLESRLSVIQGGRLFYRGRDVVALAQTASLEQAACLLWCGDPNWPFPEDVLVPADWKNIVRTAHLLPPLEALQVCLAFAAAADSHAFDLRAAAVQRAGARILRLLAAAVAGVRPAAIPVARVLRQRWCGADESAERLLQAMLVLYADNGLNPSSFTARCVASAGSTPYAVVSAGLAALQGSKHGGACERAAGVIDELKDARAATRLVTARLRRGESIPGFGHPLYPAGDPRGAFLMELLREHRARSPEVRRAMALVNTVGDLMGEKPTIDFGVVAVCRALELPPSAPLALLGIARVVGWIAHGLEQYEEGREIRPRARYAGEMPRA